MIAAAYSEICGAVDQFGGKLTGMLGFFDAAVYEPKPFSKVGDIKKICPVGGGGTSFDIIFDFVSRLEERPASIVVLTDGYAPFPPERAAMGIPVIWLICNEEVTPPWGRIARIRTDEESGN